jgi:serine/threonine protein kinase
MGASAAVHPTDQVLQAYGLGKLDDVSSMWVSKHLEGCDLCQRRVAELSSDDFLDRLQNAQAKPDKAAGSWSPSALSSIEGNPSPVVPVPPFDALPSELVDHPDYEIVRELGRGGMGVVYLAQNKLMGRPEVLKVVGRHLVDRPGVLDRFLREIRSAAKLQHANIVTAYSAMWLGQSVVLAMEYVQGNDLAKMVKTKGPLPIAHACNFIYQAALGLQHAHERGMVHRDIKPANLIVARDGKKAIVKVLDFGLAKVTSEGQTDSGLTREGQMLGTPDYIAPEQIRNAQSADIRADIYSLGCTFYYLITGGPPFRGDHLWDVYQAHFSLEAGPLNLIRPEVPVELAAIVAKMMAKEPACRFQTPGDVARALTPFFKPGASQSSGPSGEAPRVETQVAGMQGSNAGLAPTLPVTMSTAPAPAGRRPPPTGADGLAWERLIATKEDKPLIEPAKPKRVEPKLVPAKPPLRRPRWVGSALLAASLFGVMALGVAIYVATDRGRVNYEPRVIERSGANRRTAPSTKTSSSDTAERTPVTLPDRPSKSYRAGVIHQTQEKGVEIAAGVVPGAARSGEGKPAAIPAAHTAFVFDGQTSFTVAGSAGFNMTNRDYTIFARIKTRRGGTIFSKTAAQGSWVPDGKAMFVRRGRLCFDIGWVGCVESQRRVDDNAWHDVAMTYTRKDHRVLLFIEGQLDGEKPLAPKTDTPHHVVRIGYAAPAFPNPAYFDGLITDVRFYQRALNQEQIVTLPTQEPAGRPAVARWRLDSLQAAVIRDETGSGHDGTRDLDTTARSSAGTQPASIGTGKGSPSQGDANVTRQDGKAAEPSPTPKGPLEEVAHVPIRPWSNVLAFSPDNERVAIDNFWNIKLVALKTGNLIRDIAPGRPVVGQFNGVLSVAIVHDGSIIASYEGQVIKVWDRTGAQMVRDLEPVPQGLQFVDIKHSKQGGWVIGRSRNQTEIRIWDLESGKELKQYHPQSAVKSLDVHPNGRWVVSIHKDNVIRIWDARTGNPINEIADGTKKITHVRFSPGGRQLLCLSKALAAFSVVNPENGEVIQVLQGPVTNVVDAAFFPSGVRVASINADNIFRVWSVATGAQLYSRAFDKDVRSLGISPDGGYVVIIMTGEAIVYRVRS